jgi:[protein-PII] uridylyltransferase
MSTAAVTTTSALAFDPLQLRVELTAIYHQHGDAQEARKEVVDRLKLLVKDARAEARSNLERDRNGRTCAKSLGDFQDELIRLIFDYTVAHVYRATNPSDAERMAVIATGGYGRELLAPGSDIDLLFLLPYKKTPWGESVAEYMLYVLWDLGFKVGHATRTIDQCVKLARADMTIRTALLDMWLIHGDATLHQELEARFRADVVRGTEREFVDAKMAERSERHRRTGESRYKVEPNVKDGKGALRDLHTLHWLSKYISGQNVGPETVEAGIFTSEEAATFRTCEDFLWTVRCFLHFISGRAEERLTFDLQPVLADKLGYRDKGGLRGVERFMKHYFLIVKEVGDLTTILCASLEMDQVKAAPGLNRLFQPSSWKVRREVRTKTDFRVENGRLNVSDKDVFKRDPVNLIRYFAQAAKIGAFSHPTAIRLLRSSHLLIGDKLRNDPEANRIFLELLTGDENPEAVLRRMNESGVLGRFILEFGQVVAMMQFNMYHHFTVDEHLLRTIGALVEIERGDVANELPLSSTLIRSIQNKRVLYVAALLHDIAKGRIEDHSIAGARVARSLCPRFGLTAAETETVAWLIEQHLTMSNIAQSRDITDPKTVRDFADVVQSPERLKLLLLLTVADIRAVGPGVWNGWKGQLLRTLYAETEPLVSGGYTHGHRNQRVAEAKVALRRMISDLPSTSAETFITKHYPDYWLRIDTRKQADHARLIHRAETELLSLATAYSTDKFTDVTELSVYAPNHARLLALFAGACAANSANIAGAHISTTRDGFALDTFILQREFPADEDELRRAKRIGETIDKVLKGEVRLATLLSKRKTVANRSDAFQVAPEVIINNGLSDDFTVIEVAGRDRTGLLYDLTSALSDLSLDISSAHITTFGEKAVDVFYVTDLTGKKVETENRQSNIRARLELVLAGPAPVVAAPPTPA